MIAKSFARIHVANLINFGIVPLVLKNESDYDKITEGVSIKIEDFKAAVESKDTAYLTFEGNEEKIPLALNFSDRQREILLCGGMLNYTKKQG